MNEVLLSHQKAKVFAVVIGRTVVFYFFKSTGKHNTGFLHSQAYEHFLKSAHDSTICSSVYCNGYSGSEVQRGSNSARVHVSAGRTPNPKLDLQAVPALCECSIVLIGRLHPAVSEDHYRINYDIWITIISNFHRL